MLLLAVCVDDCEAGKKKKAKKDAKSDRILISAIRHGNTDMVAQLLDKGADVNAHDKVCGGAYGACTGPRGGDARTHTRIYRLWFTRMLPFVLWLPVLLLLIACGSDGLMHHGVRCVQNGYTALMVASEKGHPEVVVQLLVKGADVNAHDKVCGGAYGACTGPRKGAFRGRHRGQRGHTHQSHASICGAKARV